MSVAKSLATTIVDYAQPLPFPREIVEESVAAIFHSYVQEFVQEIYRGVAGVLEGVWRR